MNNVWVVILIVQIAISVLLLWFTKSFFLTGAVFCFIFALKDLIFYIQGYGQRHYWSNKNVAWPDPFGNRNLTKPSKATEGEKLFLVGSSVWGFIVGAMLLFFHSRNNI